MNANDEVIARSTISLLEPSEYNIFDTKHQIRNLDEIITKSIDKNYRNATNASNTKIIEMENNDLKLQLSFYFDLDPLDTNDAKEEAALDSKISHMDDTISTDVESTASNKFLGLHVTLPSDK